MSEVIRCAWCGDDPLYVNYHDQEWGVPVTDSNTLFEMICLEGAQAGLSWITILRKRESYRAAFDYFDPSKMAKYDSETVEKLLLNKGIVRSRTKVNAFITNAQSYLEIETHEGAFSDFIWQHVNHEVVNNKWTNFKEIPAKTVESEALSRSLKKKGFKFVGPVICYAFMQAAGMVNDHLLECEFK